MRRVADYLISHRTQTLEFPWNLDMPVGITVHTDSDWASCETTRRSRSGGVIQFNGYTIMHWCRMQDAIALSSAEAELKASCKGLMECLGLREALEFLTHRTCPMVHFTDASACHAVLKRRGNGAMKHISVRQLWAQEIMQRPETSTLKLPRSVNVADAMCSIGTVTTLRKHLRALRFSS